MMRLAADANHPDLLWYGMVNVDLCSVPATRSLRLFFSLSYKLLQ